MDDQATSQRAGEATSLLMSAAEGDGQAMPRLLDLVYDELRALAESYLARERPDHTLQATALVHEAYLRLVDQTRVPWSNRGHFFAVAATAMRRVLINHARARGRLKRGGGGRTFSLDEALTIGQAPDERLLALDDALTRLAHLDARKAHVVELRFFAGLTNAECAGVLGVAEATVRRDWKFAKAWLLHDLTGDADD